jgi:hypothetical protein
MGINLYLLLKLESYTLYGNEGGMGLIVPVVRHYFMSFMST